ncbi:MAG: nucleoside hydrolase [Fuerstiella sp.]|nr:nucleoside hydrolase [Fuerstiella sp.]
MLKLSVAVLTVFVLCLVTDVSGEEPHKPVPLIFDTDIGNDYDDVLALGMVHALQSRGECRLLAVTITKDHNLAAPFVDSVNTFYGRGNIPVGVCHSGITNDQGTFNGLANRTDEGRLRYPHDLQSGRDAPDAVDVLRSALAAADDGSVVIVQVGFSTNLARLLSSPGDSFSAQNGTELVRKKVRLLSIMAGAFRQIPEKDGRLLDHREYNVVTDLPAAMRLSKSWPAPIVWSGFEIGLNLPYPYQCILEDYRYATHHPLAEACRAYSPHPHDRPTWDLTSVLYAVRPEHDYFDLSEPGRVRVQNDGLTTFEPANGGRDRYLIIRQDQKARTIEALTHLASQPPQTGSSGIQFSSPSP